jgi:hypothetical protein
MNYVAEQQQKNFIDHSVELILVQCSTETDRRHHRR